MSRNIANKRSIICRVQKGLNSIASSFALLPSCRCPPPTSRLAILLHTTMGHRSGESDRECDLERTWRFRSLSVYVLTRLCPTKAKFTGRQGYVARLYLVLQITRERKSGGKRRPTGVTLCFTQTFSLQMIRSVSGRPLISHPRRFLSRKAPGLDQHHFSFHVFCHH